MTNKTQEQIELERLRGELEEAKLQVEVLQVMYGREHELAEKAESELSRVREDAERMDWMERHLCRAGEVKDNAGQTVKLCRVWSIMGELETLRETIDAHREALSLKPKEAGHE